MLRQPDKVSTHRTNMQGHRPYRASEDALRVIELQKQPLNTIMVEHGLVINLKRSQERLRMFQATNNFEGATEIIEAVDGLQIEQPKIDWMKRGDMATLRSHRIALEYARDKQWQSVIIFEDDISFPADFNSRLKQAMSELPANFDMLWGGGAIRNKDYPYTPNINIMNGRWGCYCMIIRNTVYDFFISKFKEEQHSSDTYYSEYHRKFNSFVTVQELVKHIGNVSDRMIVNHA